MNSMTENRDSEAVPRVGFFRFDMRASYHNLLRLGDTYPSECVRDYREWTAVASANATAGICLWGSGRRPAPDHPCPRGAGATRRGDRAARRRVRTRGPAPRAASPSRRPWPGAGLRPVAARMPPGTPLRAAIADPDATPSGTRP